MATIHGGLFHTAAPTPVTATARPDAGPLGLGSATAASATAAAADPSWAGGQPAGAGPVVATATQAGGGTQVTFNDGTTITIIGHITFTTVIH